MRFSLQGLGVQVWGPGVTGVGFRILRKPNFLRFSRF